MRLSGSLTLKLSTKAAVFKRVSLLIKGGGGGGTSMSIGGATPPLHPPLAPALAAPLINVFDA